MVNTNTINKRAQGSTPATSRSNYATKNLNVPLYSNIPLDTLYGNINGTNAFTSRHPSIESNSNAVGNGIKVNNYSKYSPKPDLPTRSSTFGVPSSQRWYKPQGHEPLNRYTNQNSGSQMFMQKSTNTYTGSISKTNYGSSIKNEKEGEKEFKFMKYFTFTSYTTMTFIILIICIHTLDYFVPFLNLTNDYFTTHTKVQIKKWRILELFQMFSYILGHADWDHLWGNTSQILILGNIIEEKFGSKRLAKMILITAFTGSCATFLVNAFNVYCRGLNYGYSVRGASGVVYAFWVLASVVGNNKSGKIPLELVIVLSIILTSSAFKFYWNPSTNISHMGHAIGGITGGLLGLIYSKR